MLLLFYTILFYIFLLHLFKVPFISVYTALYNKKVRGNILVTLEGEGYLIDNDLNTDNYGLDNTEEPACMLYHLKSLKVKH